MPLDLGAAAVAAALSALAAPLGEDLYEEARQKLAGLLDDAPPLERELKAAYGEAWKGFEGTLRASFHVDDQLEARLKELIEDDAFGEALARLPFEPFRAIDTAELQRQFLAMGPADADEHDFVTAWRALGRRFRRAIADEPQGRLHRLVQLADRARQEERDEAFQETLLAELGRLRTAVEAAGPARVEEPAIEEYRRALFEEQRHPDTRGLFWRERETVAADIDLSEVFVETPIAPIAPRSGKRPPDPTDPDAVDETARAEEAASAEDSARAGLEPPGPRPAAPEPRPVGRVVPRHRALVILGAPGSGKSTLLRCLALTLCHTPDDAPLLELDLPAETVPVLLPLREYASKLRDEPNAQLDSFLFHRFADRLPALRTLLQEGRALMLLDGLDEVFDETHRRWVSEEVWRLTSRFGNSRFVLTSRHHGYRAAPLPGPVPLWELQPFGDEQIGRFFTGWFRALARIGGEAGARESPDDRAEGLTKDVLGRPRLKEMAHNPLLCTLIVLVHRSRSGRLPERRFVFYEGAVRTMAELWETWKRHPEQFDRAELTYPEPDTLIRALAEVAWRAHHELGSREIPRATLCRWLAGFLDRQPDRHAADGRKAAEDLLTVVEKRLGLLLDLGGDTFQIVHLSLHEYLVAHFLLDRLNEEQSARVLRHYLHLPEWEEVLRLTVGGAPQAKAESLITALLDHPTSRFEDRIHRDLIFVCQCIGDRAAIGPGVQRRVERAVAGALEDPRTVNALDVLKTAAGLGRSDVVEEIARRWLDESDYRKYSSAVDFFAHTASDDPDVRDAFRQRLDDSDPGVHHSAVLFFGRTGSNDPGVRDTFRQRLDDPDPDVRISATNFFARTASDDPDVRNAFLQRLDDPDPDVQTTAIQFFTLTESDDPNVRDVIRQRLDDSESLVRYSAIEFFIRTPSDDPNVRNAIRERIGDADPVVRSSAVRFFIHIASNDPDVRNAIRERIDDPWPEVRYNVSQFFIQSASDDADVRSMFRQLLGDPEPEVRHSAVQFFARTASKDPDVRDTFRQQLEDPDPNVRRSAIQFFDRTGSDDHDVRNAIRQHLEDSAPDVRRSAIFFLSRSTSADPDVREAVRRRLDDPDAEVRDSAILSFARAEVDDPQVREAALQFLDDPERRRSALRYFTAVGFGDVPAVRLLEIFDTPHDRLFSIPWNRAFSERIGTAAATDQELEERIFAEGPSMAYFHTPAAANALAERLDELRRQEEPLPDPLDSTTA